MCELIGAGDISAGIDNLPYPSTFSVTNSLCTLCSLADICCGTPLYSNVYDNAEIYETSASLLGGGKNSIVDISAVSVMEDPVTGTPTIQAQTGDFADACDLDRVLEIQKLF